MRVKKSLAVIFLLPMLSSAQPKPIKLTDASGRIIELAKIPQRLIIVGKAPFYPLHLLYTFPEGRQRLVSSEAKFDTASDFLPLIDPSFKNKAVLSRSPNVEQIAALKPDLVIMKGSAIDKTCESLEKIGIPSVYVALETPEEFFKDVANLGIVLGNPKRAAEIQAFYRTRLDRLSKGTAGLREELKPRVLVLEYNDRGGKTAVQVPAKAWMQTIQVQAAGGNPVWLEAVHNTDNWTIVSFEQIARWDPDKIFIVTMHPLDPRVVVSQIKSDPQWSALKAAKNDQIHPFPGDVFGWDTPEPRWILGMDWMATHIHPQRFKDIDMYADLMAFFGELYGMSKADIETRILPTVKMDVRQR
jgi:iron complex transport system substrate-binding protein